MSCTSINLHNIVKVKTTLTTQTLPDGKTYYSLFLELKDANGGFEAVTIYSEIKNNLQDIEFEIDGYKEGN